MDLRLHLMVRIALMGLLCLVIASVAVLWRTDRELKAASQKSAESVARLFEVRLLERGIGYFRTLDPDLGALLDAGRSTGQCIRYVGPNGGLVENSCHGWLRTDAKVPGWFAASFQFVFGAGREVVRAVRYRGAAQGEVIVAPDPQYEIARAWDDIRPMLGLSAVTVLALCVLTYFVIGRALRPTKQILAALEQLSHGDLSKRLPGFRLIELQQISSSVNALAARLEENVNARRGLTQKLIRVQEEERRSLAHALHDEFGQCLAALNAMATVIVDSAQQQAPDIAAQGRRIAAVVAQMMGLLKGMLFSLRPSGIDELGLGECLRTLVTGWNASTGGRVRFDLELRGDLDLPEPIGVSVYRIVQECLTNASKHADASQVTISVERVSGKASSAEESIDVLVEDNGVAAGAAFEAQPGFGLLGMQERVTALGGRLTLKPRPSNGLSVRALIPLPLAASASGA